jgi:hypothetical protein
MKVDMTLLHTPLVVAPSADRDVQVRSTWVPTVQPNDFLEQYRPIDEALKTVSLSGQADAVLGLTTSGFALARGLRDHDNVSVGLAVTRVALSGLGFVEPTLAHINPLLPVAISILKDAAQALQDSRVSSISRTPPFAMAGVGWPYGTTHR